MNNAKKYLAAVALAGSVMSALPALAHAGGTGGSISGIGSFNNGGAKAGSGGSGNSGGNGGNVASTGSESNGGAAAGTGGSGGGVQSSTIPLRLIDAGVLKSRLQSRNLSR